MVTRSAKPRDKKRPITPRDTAPDERDTKDHGPSDFGTMTTDGFQVVNRRCTICDWEAQLVERGTGEDPLCPWCYGPTERTSVLGLVIPEALRPGQKNPYASSLGRLGGLKGGPARAAKLSAKQRKEIASKAARARWSGKQGKPAGKAAKTAKTPKRR
jgi:hypothetical protein